MKKAKMIGKKTLSIFLAVLMVLTAWVWVAPQKAEAAAGSYYIKISWSVGTSGNLDANFNGKTETNDTVGFRITFKSNNGTGSEDHLDVDLKSDLESTGNKTTAKTISGFPTEFFASLNDNRVALVGGSTVMTVKKIEIAASSTSTLYTLWEGTGQLNSTNQHKEITISPTTSTGNDSSNGYVNDTKKNWVYPYANTFTWSPENLSAMTCPKTASDAAATQTVSVTAKDQYGVQMFDPTWKVSGNIKSTGITVSPTTSSGSTTISVNSSANILNTTNSQTGTVTATWSTPNSTGNTSKTSSKDFTINDATYTAIFKNHRDANGVLQNEYTTTAQYGVTPTAPTASDYSEGDYDYTFTGWNPSVTGISGDTTYVAGYSQSDKILADYTAVNEAIAAANAIKTQCGTEYELMYTIASRVALDQAITAVVTGLGRTQQSTVDGYAKAINDALNLEPNKFAVIFLDKNGAILKYEKEAVYKSSVAAPAFPEDQKSYHDAENHYTYSGWDSNEYNSVLDDLVIAPVYTAEAHDWKIETVTSTCVQAGTQKYTCKVCGYVKYDGGDQLGDHVWEDDFRVDVAPTCVLPGSKSIHCTLCDAQKDITAIEPKGHSWEDFAVAVNPTCTNIGISTRVCAEKDCRFCEHLVIDALGHDYKKTTVAPTCTTKGYDEYVCQRENCGHSYRDNYTKDVAPHNYGAWETVSEAHCGVPGVQKQTCSCGHINLGSIDALDHDALDSLEWNVVIEDTCTDKGYRTKTCSKCNNVIASEVFDDIKGHDIKTETTDATCTTAGSIVKTCQRENCDYTDTDVIAPLGHKYEKAGAITETAATCTSSAYKTYKCDNCNYTYKEYVSGSVVTTHTWTKIDEKAADCENDGYIDYKCSVCDKATKREILPKLGHAYPETWTVEKEATNNEDGKWTRKCVNCNDVEIVVIPAGGHTFNTTTPDSKTDATCTTPGSATYKCKTKGHTCGIEITVELPLAEHTIAQRITSESCTQMGAVEAYCSACNEVFNTEEIPVKAHNFVAQEAVAPTCTTAGYTPYKCSACSFTYNVVNGAQATGHNYKAAVTKDATCTEEGVKTFTCQNDNSHKYTETIPATGHTYDAGTVVQEQSCTDVEKTEYTCACGDKYTVITKEAKGHTYTNWTVITPATADKSGVQMGTCACGDVKYDVLAPIGAHSFTETITKNPSCTEKGEKTFVCNEHENCSANYKAEIPATGHTQEIVYTAPTCITAGSTKVVCSVESCKAEILSTSIPATSKHDFSGEGEVTTAPACTVTGIMTYTCTTDGCAATKTETIPAKGHVLSTTVTDAKCGEKGSVVTECANCNDPSVEKTVELSAKGHIWGATPIETKAADCENNGSETYKC
ncbi:MAG: hypothetical protein II237_10380, partial [Clostridia bacterium]|nr:hypothetical protein [Clostridia bacterium]